MLASLQLRHAATASVAAGLGLLALSAGGIAGLRSDLQSVQPPASRLVEDYSPAPSYDGRDCPKPPAGDYRTREI